MTVQVLKSHGPPSNFTDVQYRPAITEIYILFARTLQIEAGLLQFYSCNVKHMGTSELESTTSVPIRDLYSTV